MITSLANHLWQSTLFAGVAWMLVLLLRRNRADVRYRIWLAASIKFLIPFSLLTSAGSLFTWRTSPPVAIVPAVSQIGQPFEFAMITESTATGTTFPLLPILAAIWVCGFAFQLASWYRWMRHYRSTMRDAKPLPLGLPIPVLSAPSRHEPGVFGIWSPVLLLPEGIIERLTPAQLESILAHELCHVRRADNLTAALQMIVESIFWFHPLVWWTGARLVDERERACDEEVIRLGNAPHAYAEGILNVCKYYLQSPVTCAAGVTGGVSLKRRIEAIVSESMSQPLSLALKSVIAVAGLAVIAGPLMIGSLAAQANPALTFDVVSILPSDPSINRVSMGYRPGGAFEAANVSLQQLISHAYAIPCGKNDCAQRIVGGPKWLNDARFDIKAKPPESAAATATREETRMRIQAMLADRFQLVIRREPRELSVYHLVIAKGGHKMKEDNSSDNGGVTGQGGRMISTRVKIETLAWNLIGMTGRPVFDHTGLTGRYTFDLDFVPEKGGNNSKDFDVNGADGSPSLFTALEEQLGLKLVPHKGPVEVLVIERAEKPTAN